MDTTSTTRGVHNVEFGYESAFHVFHQRPQLVLSALESAHVLLFTYLSIAHSVVFQALTAIISPPVKTVTPPLFSAHSCQSLQILATASKDSSATVLQPLSHVTNS